MKANVLLLLLFYIASNTAIAQTRCASDLFYTWKKNGDQTENQVVVQTLRASAEDEAKAKSALQIDFQSKRAKVIGQCRQDHEEISRCLSSKLAAIAPVMQGLSFVARKALEEAVTKECAKGDGVCSKADMTEAKCEVLALPAGAEGKGGKDEGGKPAKKKK